MPKVSSADRRALVKLENRLNQVPKKGEAGYVPAHSDPLPVRLCTTECTYRRGNGVGCWHFQHGKAEDGSMCVPDLKKIEEWRRAYEGGDAEVLKKDAGRIMGSMFVKAREMLEIIDKEGFTLRAPRTDVRGRPVTVANEQGLLDYIWEVKPHPLIDSLIKVLKLLDLDPAEFGMTPKSSASAGQSVSGNIHVGKIDINVLLGQQQERSDEFKRALERSLLLREGDPVYRRFAGGSAPEEEVDSGS